jgi:hypothetical protein
MKQTADKSTGLAAGKIRIVSWYALNYTDDTELIKMLNYEWVHTCNVTAYRNTVS